MPPSITAMPSSEVAMGRWMKGDETLMAGRYSLRFRNALPLALAPFPLLDGGLLVVLLLHRDLADRHRVVGADYINESPVRATLDRRRRHHDDAVQCLDQESHVDELARPELQVLVRELGFELHCAGGL